MRILFVSHVFSPSVGGIENVSARLAAEFARLGHEVRLVTQTPGTGIEARSFAVYRRPSARTLLELHRWCELCFHNNVSLARAWPLLFVSRPWVVAHHVWIPRTGAAAVLKRFFLRYATGIAASRALAEHLSTPSTVIPNPYDEGTFKRLAGVEKRRDLVFVGRLVSDKGADLLLAAVAALRKRGLRPTATIVGDGPEGSTLKRQCAALGLGETVAFAGRRSGRDLARLLNEHRIVVVPSVWAEPFGIVALEGIACGCVAVGSAAGGLRDAIGECGETFANGDVGALTNVLASLLSAPDRSAALLAHAGDHLRKHGTAAVTDAYLRVFAHALAGNSARDDGKPPAPLEGRLSA
jgi:glycosyltransferase involved in cell wall biosynthesis